MGAIDLSSFLWPDAAQGRQPQGQLQIDWSNPIARGLIVCSVPSVGSLNVATDARGIQTNPNGINAVGVTSEALLGGYGSLIPIKSKAFEAIHFLAIINLRNRPAYGPWISVYSSALGLTRGFSFSDNLSAGGLNATPNLFINVHNTNYNGTTTIYAASTAKNNIYKSKPSLVQMQWGMGVNSGVGRLWVDGTILPNTGGSALTTASNWGNDSAPAAYITHTNDSSLSLLLFWDRALSEDEVAQLNANPWQIFAAPSIPLFSTAAISGCETSISSTTGNSTGAIVSSSTSKTTISATASNAVGSVVSRSATKTVITATTASAVGSIDSKTICKSTVATTTANAIGSVSSKVTCKTAVTATTSNAVGAIASSNVGVCTTAINVTTADATGAIVSKATSKTGIAATSSNALGSVTSKSTPKTTFAATTDSAVGAISSTSVYGVSTRISATLAGVFGSITSTSGTTPFTPDQLIYLEANYVTTANINDIAAAVLAALQATAIPVNTVLMNTAPIIGDGSESNPWRGVGVPN